MRRKEREIDSPAELTKGIETSEYGILSMLDGDAPYAIPMNFAYDGQYLYAHTAHEGKKLDLLKINPKVHINFVPEAVYVPGNKNAASCTMRYVSISVSGMAKILDKNSDLSARKSVLKILCERFGAEQLPIPEAALAKTTIICITPDKITGKRNPIRQAV